MRGDELEKLSDLLGDFLILHSRELSGSEKDSISDARRVVEEVIEAL